MGDPGALSAATLTRHAASFWRLVRQHIGITPCPRSDPAPGQPPQPAHSPGMRPAGNTARIDHHSAQVAPVGVAPAQGQAGPRAPPRNQHTQRARLRQATQATAVARRPLNGLGGRLGVQPYNRGCRGWRRWHGLQKSKKIGFCCCSRAACNSRVSFGVESLAKAAA